LFSPPVETNTVDSGATQPFLVPVGGIIVWMAAPSFRGSNSNSRNEYGNWRRIKPAAQILGDCREAAILAAWKQI
jgi:hypothetical protein